MDVRRSRSWALVRSAEAPTCFAAPGESQARLSTTLSAGSGRSASWLEVGNFLRKDSQGIEQCYLHRLLSSIYLFVTCGLRCKIKSLDEFISKIF